MFDTVTLRILKNMRKHINRYQCFKGGFSVEMIYMRIIFMQKVSIY